MDKLERNRNLWLFALIDAILFGLLGGLGCVIFAMNLKYALLVISFLLLGHGFFGVPIYYHLYANACLRIKIRSLLRGKRVAFKLLTEELRLTEKALRRELLVCMKHKYIPQYEFEGDELIRITTEKGD